MAIRFWEIYEESHKFFRLRLLAGKGGMDHVVGWVHMLEDETIISRFSGQELVVTTGMKAQEKDWLLHLVMAMKQTDSTGIIINTGMYLHTVPQDVIDWCDEHDFPLLVMPWEISIPQLIQSFCTRIMQRTQKEKEFASSFKEIIKGHEISESLLAKIRTRFDPDGYFRIFCIRIRFGVEDTTAFLQAMLKLENTLGLWQKGKHIRLPYLIIEYDDCYALTLNNFPADSAGELSNQILNQFSYFTQKNMLSLGIGPEVQGISQLKAAFKRAQIAAKMALQTRQNVVDFNEMGFFKILFSSDDTAILKNYEQQLLGPLDEYDQQHHADYVQTLRSYIKYDRSLAATAKATYTHRNTVNYRIQNIKRLLGCELKTAEDLFPYQVAFYIRDMQI